MRILPPGRLLILFLLSLFALPLFSQTSFQKVFGGPNGETASGIVQTSDGGYIIAGSTWSYGSGAGDFYLIKTDFLGQYQWMKTYGTASDERATCVNKTSDGGYVMCGSTDNGTGNLDIYAVKTDASGNLQWSNTFGGANTELAFSIQELANGNYILTGYTNTYTNGGNDVYLLNLTSVGALSWSKNYGGIIKWRSRHCRYHNKFWCGAR